MCRILGQHQYSRRYRSRNRLMGMENAATADLINPQIMQIIDFLDHRTAEAISIPSANCEVDLQNTLVCLFYIEFQLLRIAQHHSHNYDYEAKSFRGYRVTMSNNRWRHFINPRSRCSICCISSASWFPSLGTPP
jgi:hypothetical protein